MERAPPYLLTVYDPTEGRLLRVERFPTERDLTQHELEERDHYMRHPEVEVEGHAGLAEEDVLARYEERARRERKGNVAGRG